MQEGMILYEANMEKKLLDKERLDLEVKAKVVKKVSEFAIELRKELDEVGIKTKDIVVSFHWDVIYDDKFYNCEE